MLSSVMDIPFFRELCPLFIPFPLAFTRQFVRWSRSLLIAVSCAQPCWYLRPQPSTSIPLLIPPVDAHSRTSRLDSETFLLVWNLSLLPCLLDLAFFWHPWFFLRLAGTKNWRLVPFYFVLDQIVEAYRFIFIAYESDWWCTWKCCSASSKKPASRLSV